MDGEGGLFPEMHSLNSATKAIHAHIELLDVYQLEPHQHVLNPQSDIYTALFCALVCVCVYNPER